MYASTVVRCRKHFSASAPSLHPCAPPLQFSSCSFCSLPKSRSCDTGLATCVRRMSQLERITFNPNQCGGRPCIRGMRIRVKDVLDMLASGASEAEVLESYPYLEREDIQAALEYAARQVDHTVVSLAK